MSVERYWINQPSGLQLLHELHGTNVLAEPEKWNPNFMRIHFLNGEIISMQVPKSILSEGWKS